MGLLAVRATQLARWLFLVDVWLFPRPWRCAVKALMKSDVPRPFLPPRPILAGRGWTV